MDENAAESTAGHVSPPLGELVKEWFGIKRITTNRSWWSEQAAEDRLIRPLVRKVSIPPLLIVCALAGVFDLAVGSSRALTVSVVAALIGVTFVLLTTGSKVGVARNRRRIEALLDRSRRRNGVQAD